MGKLRSFLLFALAAGCLHASERLLPPDPDALPKDLELTRAFVADKADPWTFTPGGEDARAIRTSPAAPWDLRRAARITVRARDLGGARRIVRLRWYVHSHVGGRYQAAKAFALPASGETTEVSVALAQGAGALSPVGHQRPWDELAAAEVLALELRAEVTGDREKSVKLVLDAPELALDDAGEAAEAPRLLDVALFAPPGHIEAAAELRFVLDPLPADPFAAEGEGDVRVQAGHAEALAFLDQPHYRVPEGGASYAAPAGRPHYRAFLPRLPAGGAMTVVSGERRWQIPLAALPLQAAPHSDETPLTSPPRWSVPLEVPLGLPRGSAAEKLWAGAPAAWLLGAAAEEPWKLSERPAAERAWRPVVFWNPRWGGFGGARRPDFALAQCMDDALAQAHGPRRPLVLLDGETLAAQGTFTWHSHPLNASQGGRMAGPGEVLRSEQGLDFCRRAARYAVARWGRAKAVDSFLFDASLNAPGAADLHARLALSAQGWPGVGSAPGAKPLYALHPLAREPQPVADVGHLRNPRPPGGAWYAGEPHPVQVGLLELREAPSAPLLYALQAAARTDLDSVCAIKPLDFAAVDYRFRPPDDFHPADALLFDVWLPPDAPADLRAGVHLRDRDRMWYQTLLPGLLRPGDWTTCLLDLRGGNAQDLKPLGHAKPWTEYSRMRLTEIGLHVYTTHPKERLSARFARVRAVTWDQAAQPEARRIELLAEPPKELHAGQRWEAHLAINRTYANPFDMAEVDLAALVTTPSGQTLRVPAFFDMPCRRREANPGGAEIVEPSGPERWTVRFRAAEAGPHTVKLELREGGRFRVAAENWQRDWRFSPEGEPYAPAIKDEEDWVYSYRIDQRAAQGRRKVEDVVFEPGAVAATLDLGRAFTVKGRAEGWRGFVRVDEGGRYFRMDDGSFYWAIGPCLRSPSDNRLPYKHPRWTDEFLDALAKRGTYQFDAYFEKFQAAGINWARVWMCSWWGALQWRRDWPGYQGYRRFNLLNAWRMDRVLDEAERRGIYINLCLTNHGQFSHVIDTEWAHNPYNATLGGPLSSPSEFFTRAEPKIAHQNFLRYAAARYGHSPAVLTWALFSELEFTDEYRPCLRRTDMGDDDLDAPNLAAWHAQMARFLKTQDPWRHPVSTHFSHPVRGLDIFRLPEIEIAMSNAYSAFDELNHGRMDAAAALHDYYHGCQYGQRGQFRGMKIYAKPVLVEEQGRHWMGVEQGKQRNSRDQLDADLHCGLWGSLVQPLAGATGYWWWLHVHFDERYGEFKALAEFLKGEDLRPQRGERMLETVAPRIQHPDGRVVARALAGERRAYVWVYDALLPHRYKGLLPIREATLELDGLARGAYSIEFWDTTVGKVLGRGQGKVLDKATGGLTALTILLPEIRGDLALKIKPADEAPADPPRRGR